MVLLAKGRTHSTDISGIGWRRTILNARTSSLHTITNIEIVKCFLDIEVTLQKSATNFWEIEIFSESLRINLERILCKDNKLAQRRRGAKKNMSENSGENKTDIMT
ncbi:hypothetical protein CSA56_09365 [candidate division KSB3 bacterium]|uniref:Uncharacterized protein n=1 Tax=candidate division KSB3 bacterium TaxID=2044937 RepID=A0A2G6KE06_9BACT|nr:MAG: hypothetical protein CSA56_09365 [candidate division KSB3 bacterium]